MSTRRRPATLLALAAVLAVVAGCGGGDGDQGSGQPSGQLRSATGFDGTTISLGVVTPLTGPAAVIGEPLTAGNQVFVDALNARGGIAGKYKVKLVSRDSQYQTPVAVQAYSAMKNEVAMFVQVLGTPIVSALVPQFKADKTVAAPASLDAFWVREPNLLPVGAPYQIEAINALDYYVNSAGGKGKRICVLYADNPYGQAGLAGARYAAERLGFQLGATPTLKTGDSDFTAQLGQLRSCQAVFLTALPAEGSKIFAAAARARFNPQWIANIPVWTPALAQSPLAPYLQQTLWIAGEGPTWGDESVPGMKRMMDDLRRFRPNQKADFYFVFGYAQAWAAADVLEQAVAAGDLGRDGILAANNKPRTVNFGGLFGDYTYGPPAERKPPRKTTVFRVDPAVPTGLSAVKADIESEAARSFNLQ